MRIRETSAKVLCLALALSLGACVTPNEVAMKVGAPPEIKKDGADGKTSVVNLRALQVRRFETGDERKLLLAATQTLQDLGFTIEESSLEAGVLVGHKKRDAEESGQVAGQVAVTILLALMGSAHNPTWDKEQTIIVSLVTTPIKNSKQVEARVTFDRRLTNNHGKLWRTELVTDAEIYKEFFDKLSQATFLEAQAR